MGTMARLKREANSTFFLLLNFFNRSNFFKREAVTKTRNAKNKIPKKIDHRIVARKELHPGEKNPGL
jgi:hypothetical protein